jgi:hypothetical protein
VIELLLDLIIAIFVFCLGVVALYVIFWLPVMAIGGIIGKIADARDARRDRRPAAKLVQIGEETYRKRLEQLASKKGLLSWRDG